MIYRVLSLEKCHGMDQFESEILRKSILSLIQYCTITSIIQSLYEQCY